MAIVVQPADPSQLPSAITLLQEANLPTEGVAGQFGSYLAAVDQGAVVGLVGLEISGSAALLRSLVVASSHRGQGLGKRLVQAAEEIAPRQGVKSLYILTETAELFFRLLRYKEVDRQDIPPEVRLMSEFRTLCPASAQAMAKDLVGGRPID